MLWGVTGTMGLKGNLTAGEIIEQLVHALRVTPVRNVVFMVSSL
jgi:adenine C2-methylase RlmN of 23S rRNA A2503 and tRNA A37